MGDLIGLDDSGRMVPVDRDALTADVVRHLAEVHAPGLMSFCFQHLGKQRLDQGRVVEAKALLEAALALRVAQGDPELVESTKAALRLASSVERRP